MYFYYLHLIAVVSFFVLLKKTKRINNPQTKLQVKGCKRYTYSSRNISRDKSTFPLSLNNGSITLEATMVLSIFILSVLSIYYFFNIINYQNIMQMSINNVGKSIGRYAYVLEKGESYGDKTLKDNNEIDVDKDIIANGITTTYAWNKIISGEVEKYTSVTNVPGGKKGISILNSNLSTDTGENDLVVNYKIGINILGIKNIKYKLVNRCFFRAWIGESIVDISDKIEQQTVYITSSGKVYHLYKNCSHIKLSVSAVIFKDIGDLRNINGGKYYKCDKCVHKSIGSNETVYITDSGTAYHLDSKCSGIKRNISEADISDVKDRKLCSRCRQEYEKINSNK